jgi:hypothetical protein
MENHYDELEVLQYISQPVNDKIKDFLLAVQRYYLQYGLKELFPILPFLEQINNWLKQFETNKTMQGSYGIKIELALAKFDVFEKFVFLDILTSFLFLLKIDNFNFLKTSSTIESLENEKKRVIKRISSLTKSDIKSLIDGFSGQPKTIQIDKLNCYRRLYYRITKTNQHTSTDFSNILDMQISLLSKEVVKLPIDVSPESLDNLIKEQQVTNYNDNTKLLIKDVASILKCHSSQVRRLILKKINPLPHYRETPRGRIYFFYNDIIEWMKSNKQKTSIEEAGEVFRRKSTGAGKKRRPRLE